MADDYNSDGFNEEPIIIKKKKGHGGHGHHGGAWKVAYADFVTAMMAFFIVMWILGQSPEVKESVEYYFKKPQEFNIFTGKRGSLPIDLDMHPSDLGDGKSIEKGEGQGDDKKEIRGKKDTDKEFNFFFDIGNKDSITNIEDIFQKAVMDSSEAAEKVNELESELKEYISMEISQKPELDELLESIEIELTSQGLRIELVESTDALFFEIGCATLKKRAVDILEKLAHEIGKLPNMVEIEGHTDSRQYSQNSAYTNWELSSDRAHAARRVLESRGLWPGQITNVTGYADRQLSLPENPYDIANRRVTIMVQQMKVENFLPEGAAPAEQTGGN